MRIEIPFGRALMRLELAEGQLLTAGEPAVLPDSAAALRTALEAPVGYPPLRRALTPDDRLTLVVDESLPDLATLLPPLLEHITAAGVSLSAVTLLVAPGPGRHDWVDELPDEFEEVHFEVHDPADQRRLAYLATTAGGKRLYLNRTLVEADQVVVLSARRYDLLLGRAGGEGALYPALADEPTRREMVGRLNLEVPGRDPWPAQREAEEVTWLLGQPYFIQAVPGPGDTLAHLVTGTAEALAEGARRLDTTWRREVPRSPDLVIAALGGDPDRHSFADMAAAVANAARVVRPGGVIVLLTQAGPEGDPAVEALRKQEDAESAVAAFRRDLRPETAPALRWALGASQARLFVHSGLADQTVEEIHATPLAGADQVQRLLSAGGSCLILEDAHKVLAVPA